MQASGEARSAAAIALRMLAIGVGVFFVAMSASKLDWLTDTGLLLLRFQTWRPDASPAVGWYLDTIAIPGVELFARLVPIAELATGLGLIFGVWTRVTALLALLMVLNFHYATNAFTSLSFLRDGTGPPLLAGLIALAIGGKDLPFTLSVPRTPRVSPSHALDRPNAYTELS